MAIRIGIDVGGTNTDAVAMKGSEVVAWVKRSTTADVTDGIVSAIRALLDSALFAPDEVSAVMVGTTHFTNAVVEAKRLAPTGVIRIGLPATASLPPLVDWPARLRTAIGDHTYLCRGGHEFDGRAICELDRAELRRIAADLAGKGIRSVAISAVFAPIDPGVELEAAELIREAIPDVAVSLSSELGRIGLLERENATVMNACLRVLADQTVRAFEAALDTIGITAGLFISQNDGTLMSSEFTRQYPVATFASGPTNSMRGAAYLSGVSEAAVVDVGGTTADIGVLAGGYPREAPLAVDIGGVRTNFRMPDVLSLGIGGGSLVRRAETAVRVGPDSVGYELTERALVFGGSTLTATDVAVAAGLADIGDTTLVAEIDRTVVVEALASIQTAVIEAVDRMKTSPDPIPVIVVGGGGLLIQPELAGASQVIRPEFASVANAIGAAMARVGGEVDRICSLGQGERERVLAGVAEEAVGRAVAAGADPSTIEVVAMDEVPLSYLPGNAVRVRAKAVGELLLPAEDG